MSEVQGEHVSNSVLDSQIKSATSNLHFFLAWVLFACIYNQLIYFFYFKSFSIPYTIWLIIFTTILLICFCFTLFFNKSNQISIFNLDMWAQLVCLITGAGLAIGIYTVLQLIPEHNPEVKDIHMLTLAGLMLSIVYTFAILFLSQRLRYFLYVFLPSASTIVLSNFLFLDNTPDVFSLIFNIWFGVLLICALLTHKMYRRLGILNSHNKFYLSESRKHLMESSLLQEKLKNEIEKSKEIENQLQMHNQLLEQKVIERTYDINKINDRLQHHQANLDFAHETAGISSWLWNIEKRTIEISGIKYGNQVLHYQSATDQINGFIHPEDQENYRKELRRHLRGNTERFEAHYRTKVKDQWFWIKDIGRVITRDPKNNKPLKMVGIFQDIESEKKAQEKLKLASNVFNQVAQGVFVLDNNLCFLEVNPYFSELVNIPPQDIITKHIFDITKSSTSQLSQHHADITQTVLLTGQYDAEVTEEFISGKILTLWLHINAVRDDKNRVLNYVGIISDLTERKQNLERMAYLENYDLLTDLPNRVYFNLQLHQYLISKSKILSHFSIIRLNIDRFRHFNEFINHQTGDQVLKEVSRRLKYTCSKAVLISYLNNDDFAMIYNLNHSHYTIQQVVDQILEAFEIPFIIDGQEHMIHVSLGIAIYPNHGRQIGSLNSHAESALTEAKKLGGSTAYYYDNKPESIFGSDIELERDLRLAIKNQDLEIYYQPKIESKTMQVSGFEALIRWNHPKYGIIMPDRFIPIAEMTSLISDIGKFVIFQTCKQLKIWHELGFDKLQISINVVAQQIHRGEFLNFIDQAVLKYSLKPEFIEFELTESSLLDKSSHVFDLLDQIKDKNFSIALDDFGTGYSSLAYLADYPIDTLKIDRAFISKIGTRKNNAIVDAIISMGKAMGMKLVAEGVEDLEQIEYLRKQGCDYFQGYYFSKPLNAIDSTQYLKNEAQLSQTP
ncbi:EAL domain-containing protein [Acinetobacter sp. YH12239]|uniref:EAL domain-containing protein n=1 Tax=Acinetobacter sp. YH12239 TaxID=2601166 RepID=UPI0015D3B071|nr:EAL domain-containing protein [Acinetobacter sp. YH12239]